MQTIAAQRLSLKPGMTVADIGCGEGRHTLGMRLAEDVQAIGVDLHQPSLDEAQRQAAELGINEGIQWINASALELPLEDASIDRVICSEVLEHIEDYHGVLKELDRIAKPDAIMAVSVPRAWSEEICWRLSDEYYQTEGGHIRIFNRIQLQKHVELLGWKLTQKHGAHAYHTPYWWLKCRYWGDDNHKLVRRYQGFLEYQILNNTPILDFSERLLNPWLGKSTVMYFERV